MVFLTVLLFPSSQFRGHEFSALYSTPNNLAFLANHPILSRQGNVISLQSPYAESSAYSQQEQAMHYNYGQMDSFKNQIPAYINSIRSLAALVQTLNSRANNVHFEPLDYVSTTPTESPVGQYKGDH